MKSQQVKLMNNNPKKWLIANGIKYDDIPLRSTKVKENNKE